MTTEPKMISPLPMPQREPVKVITVEVSRELYAVTRREMKRRKMTVRKLVDWALSSYLAAHNPDEATRLGIKVAC